MVKIMEVKITKLNENLMLERKEINATISFGKSTPNRTEIKEMVCTKIGINPDCAILSRVRSKMGVKSIDVVVHAYPTKEAVLVSEPKYILVREKMAEKKPKKEKKKSVPTVKK